MLKLPVACKVFKTTDDLYYAGEEALTEIFNYLKAYLRENGCLCDFYDFNYTYDADSDKVVCESSTLTINQYTSAVCFGERIKDYATYQATGIEDLKLPFCEAIPKLYKESYLADSQLTNITANNCKYIAPNAFSLCNKLLHVNINGPTYVDSKAFRKCESLTSIKMDGCKYISNEAFFGCSEIYSLELPQCEYIGKSAFRDCKYIKEISLPSCKVIDDYAFSDVPLRSINLPLCVKLGVQGYYTESSLVYVNLPECILIGEEDKASSTELVNTFFSFSRNISTIYAPKCINVALKDINIGATTKSVVLNKERWTK